MERLDLSDNILPIVSVAMYGTRLDPENWAENYFERLDDDGITYDRSKERFDRDAWDLRIIDLVSATIQEEWLPMMKKYGIVGAVGFSIHHPHYYNFENDELYFSLDVEDGWREKILARFKEAWENSEEVRNYAKENYTSYDGFTSWTSNTYEELSQMKTMQDIAAVIFLVSLYDGFDREGIYNQMIEDAWEQLDYGDFVTFEEEEDSTEISTK